jgi:hypothetical protein
MKSSSGLSNGLIKKDYVILSLIYVLKEVDLFFSSIAI